MSVLAPVPLGSLGDITTQSQNGLTLLRLTGDIDGAAVEAYERRETPDPAVVRAVDLTGVTFLSLSGLEFLIRRAQSARDRGELPVLLRASRAARRILQVTGAISLFQLAP